MGALARRILNLDRRIIFLAVGIVLILPIVHPLGFPGLVVTPPVQGVFDAIEALAPGDPILVSFDFDPASKPELYPQGVAVIRHAFQKNLRVIGMGHWITGVGMATEILNTTAQEFGKQYGRDYVFMGWQPQPIAVISTMGQDIYRVFPKDHRSNDLASLDVMRGVRALKDFKYLLSLAAGTPGIETWVVYGTDKFKIPMGGGSTAVIAPGLRPYLDTKQITGLIGAMKGAAEYEKLLYDNYRIGPGLAIAGMDALSLAHILLVALILLANLAYFVSRMAGAKRRRRS